MHKRIYFMLLVVAVFSMMVVGASANISIDEDFEDATPFENLGWPNSTVDGDNNGPAPVLTGRGINVRAYNMDYATADPALGRTAGITMTSGGAVTSDRYFKGTQSYELNAGESLVASTIPSSSTNWFHFIQFAVSVDESAGEEVDGTVLGSFAIRYANSQAAYAANTVNDTLTINFVVEAGQVKLIATNTGAVVGSIYPGSGNWAVVSVIDARGLDGADGPVTWKALRPSTNTYAGPQPLVSEPNTETDDDWTRISGGLNIYVNSNVGTLIAPDAGLSAEWGGPGEEADSTYMLGWTISSTTGDLYIDELLQDAGVHNNRDWVIGLEATERMLDFNDTETAEPAAASVGASWLLY